MTYDVGKLSLSHKVLSFGSHELLLECHKLGAGGFLVLEPLDLVAYLSLLVPARLHTRFDVSDLLQNGSVFLQILREEILLFTDLRENDTNLVRDVRDGVIVGRLAPVGQLGCDGQTLATCSLVGSDSMVLGLDQLEELLGQLSLLDSAQGGDGEVVLGSFFGVVVLLAGPDR